MKTDIGLFKVPIFLFLSTFLSLLPSTPLQAGPYGSAEVTLSDSTPTEPAEGGRILPMIQTLPLDDLVIISDTIVIAEPESSKAVGKDESGFSIVECTLRVSKILKGTGTPKGVVTVQVATGFEDAAVFPRKQNVVLFLTRDPKNPQQHLVTNLIQGVWPLDDQNQPMGMGTGITLEQLRDTIARTKGMKASPTPPSDLGTEL